MHREKEIYIYMYILKLNTVYIFSNIFILCLYFPKMFTQLLKSIISVVKPVANQEL
jgi:hypothetical protein